ncbi:hypothetical protein GGI23_003294 [Coemansia sp. RSA 2559]|nr:hypothetical protein GGI23_003294 [Coemansia sp. RSA 2559]
MTELATFVGIDNIVNSWRQRVLFFIDTTIWGRIWDIIDFLLNATICIIYVVNTAVVGANDKPGRIPTANRLIEFLVAVMFLGQYVARYVVINANHRSLEHFIVFFAFVSPISAYIMSAHSQTVRNSYMSAGVMAIFYPARFLRLHYAIKRLLALVSSSVKWLRLTLIRREATSLGSDIVVAILFFASIVHSGIYWYAQKNDLKFDGFNFLDAIYFISMSALGSDDSIPRSTFSEIISMAIVGLIAFAVPSRVTRLVDLAIKTSSYTKTVSLPKASRHALVCGTIELESIRQFLHEFFNSDHGPNIFKTTIAILHPDEPTMEMKALLQDPVYTNRVFYVKGFKALKRARVDLASCVYILTRKYSHGSGIDEDAETILTALSLSAFNSSQGVADKQFADAMVQEPQFQVFAQTILPGSMVHMSYLQTSRVVCVDEMRMGIMAQNCATPGFATLAFMLSKSVGEHNGWDFSGVLSESLAYSQDEEWVKTYMHGISQEIYQAHVPRSLVGKSFFKATRYFYRCHGLLIFGVGSFSCNKPPHKQTGHHPSLETADSGYYQVLLSPRNYVLQKHDMLFAISTDIQSVLDAMMYSERVSIRSTHIKRVVPHRPADDSIDEKHGDTPSEASELQTVSNTSASPGRFSFFNMLASSGVPGMYRQPASDSSSLPAQAGNSPRRMVLRTPGAASNKHSRQTNYLSDSDSSYFSPAHKNSGKDDDDVALATPSVKGAVRTRFEKVARRNNAVPPTTTNHVVICDASDVFPRNVELLVQSLKHAFEDDDLPIVILSPSEIDSERKMVLHDFSHVYLVRGTPLSRDDLHRTRIEYAQKAIVLANCSARQSSSSSSSAAAATDAATSGGNGDSTADSAAILTNMNIQSVCGGQFFVTSELLDVESIRYLDHTQLLGEPLLKRTFMGGHIFMPSMIDTALCQCYFSSHILDVLRHLTFSHVPGTSGQQQQQQQRQHWRSAIATFKPGKLSLMHVPPRFIGKRYDTLVLTLMKQHGAVPLGLYRIVSHKAQAFATVMCNPPPSLSLLPSDAVYVLGPDIPGWLHYTESLRAIRIAHHHHQQQQQQQQEDAYAASEPASPTSSDRAGKDGSGQGTASSQSRHTVYSHNTEPSLDSPNAAAGSSAVRFYEADAGADADVSDVDGKESGSGGDGGGTLANASLTSRPSTSQKATRK